MRDITEWFPDFKVSAETGDDFNRSWGRFNHQVQQLDGTL